MSAPWFPALLVTFAGFCSLVYQVVWERIVKYSFGADSTSAAIVTGTFLLGPGIGAATFGRWRRYAFTVFAVVEAALGAWAIASYEALAPLLVQARFVTDAGPEDCWRTRSCLTGWR